MCPLELVLSLSILTVMYPHADVAAAIAAALLALGTLLVRAAQVQARPTAPGDGALSLPPSGHVHADTATAGAGASLSSGALRVSITLLWAPAGTVLWHNGDIVLFERGRHADVATAIAAALLAPGTLLIKAAKVQARPPGNPGDGAHSHSPPRDVHADTATAHAGAPLSLRALCITLTLLHTLSGGTTTTLSGYSHAGPSAACVAALLIPPAHAVIKALVRASAPGVPAWLCTGAPPGVLSGRAGATHGAARKAALLLPGAVPVVQAVILLRARL